MVPGSGLGAVADGPAGRRAPPGHPGGRYHMYNDDLCAFVVTRLGSARYTGLGRLSLEGSYHYWRLQTNNCVEHAL
eukprot:scaffold127786_cov16-Prasinocladus_malaysianus.AAC.1